MKERPILFSAPMVRAILEGRKTQTRRLVKLPHHNPLGVWEPCVIGGESGGRTSSGETIPQQQAIWHTRTGDSIACPHGQPGDRLWVRETFTVEHQVESDQSPPHSDGRPVYQCPHGSGWRQAHYRATDPAPELQYEDMSADCEPECRWKPSIHMPRWASRILLEVVSVRAERLHDISEAGALAEGVSSLRGEGRFFMDYRKSGNGTDDFTAGSAKYSFQTLWESIRGEESWNANPWVWVIEFRKVSP